MADEQRKPYLGIDPKELEGLSPRERAALYKRRQQQAGIGGAPAQGEQKPAETPKEPQPAPREQPAQEQPAQTRPARPAAAELSPEELAALSPEERAALYKQRQREAGFVPPRREEGAPPPPKPPEAPEAKHPAPPTPTGTAKPAPSRPAAAGPGKAAPEKPAEPEPDTEEIKRLRELVPDLAWERVHGYAEVTIPAEQLVPAARMAKAELGYDYLSSVTAVDYHDHFLMIYHLYSFGYNANPGCLVLQVKLPRVTYPCVDSLTALWAGANFQEREVWDLMGIKFLGHPDLRRILLSDDFPGHPLRKDFEFDYEYVLVRHLRYGVRGQNPVGYVPPHEELGALETAR